MSNEKARNGDFLLIVEDDVGTSELEAQRLEPLGLDIRKASKPAETLEILKGSSPRLMLLDYSFPGMNALELIARLKKNSIQVPPFIVVTGRGDEAVAVNSMKAGALDYIVKDSYFLDNILQTARKALEKSELQSRLQKAEEAQRKSLRLYNFLAQVNHAVAKEKDRDKLFSLICEIAVTTGGFALAWVGEADKDVGRVLPLCSAGPAADYLRSLRVDLGGGEYTTSPMGTAAAKGEIAVSPDIVTDPAFKPWREKGLKAGFRSAAALPLLVGGKLMALLGLYSAEPFFFTDEEVKLLAEIQGDVSLALEAISTEERRQAAQAALERTSGQLAHLMEVNPVLSFKMRLLNRRLVTEWVSGNVEDLTGYDAAELLEPDWLEKTIHPLDKESLLSGRAALQKNGASIVDFRLKKKGNGYFWVHEQLKAVLNEEVIGSWTDITKLKESEERFQELFRETPIGYQSLDARGMILAVNNTWVRTFGVAEEEALGRDFLEFLTPPSKEAFKKLFPEFKKAEFYGNEEFEIVRKDGAVRRISFNCRAAFNQDGTFKQSHCVFNDITDTWRAREQMDLLGEAVRASFNEVYIFDPETFRFIFVNYGAVKNLGYAPEELEYLAPWDLEHKFTEASFRAAAAPLLEGKLSKLVFETEHTRKDATAYPVEVRLQLVETGKKRVFLAVANDITERRKNEKIMLEMETMQRVESLGQLAGGIAHDFNNMLTGIMANISLLETRCGGGDLEILHETLEAARSAQSLVTSLLAFSKGGKPVKKELCLGRVLPDIFKLATSGAGATSQINVPEGLWSVNGDENQLKQAINNLLLNGLQAMQSGGKLRLEARNISRGTKVPDPLPPGEYVKITVSDTGLGIAEKDLSRIFDPYFTTKARGHGLGLSMVWSVVKNHGGHTEVTSAPGKGSSFAIYLPATGRCLKEEAAAKKADISKGAGRILVLEDEEVVSHAVRRMLAELGYTCELVSDGKEAVRRYIEEEKAGRPFAAVIMDLTIPGGLGGKWAVRRLREEAAGAKVIVSSGYSDDAVMADFKANGFDAVLPKPYKYEDLAETLKRLLKK